VQRRPESGNVSRVSITATLLVLLSAVLHVTWNSLAKGSESPVVFMGLKGAWLLAIALVALPSLGVSEVPASVWPAVVASGGLHALYALALARAYERGDISFVYPIARSAPAFVPLFAWLFLAEHVSAVGLAGILLVVGGVLMLQMRDGAVSFDTLRRSLARADGRWAFVTLGCVVAYSLVDKSGMRSLAEEASGIASQLRGPLYFLLENTIAYALYLGVLLWRTPANARSVARTEWRSAAVGAVLTMASYSLILHVMQQEPLSYIVAVRQCSVVLAALYGWLWLREHQGRARLWLSVMIAAGVGLVVSYG